MSLFVLHGSFECLAELWKHRNHSFSVRLGVAHYELAIWVGGERSGYPEYLES